MAQEHNEPHSKAPLQPQLNPYAPPLSSLAPPTQLDKLNRPLESQILDLLNSLANDPIQVCAQLDEFLFDGAVRAEPQGNRVGRGFRAAMIITGIASFSFLLLRDFRLLAISVAIAASIGLLTAARVLPSTDPETKIATDPSAARRVHLVDQRRWIDDHHSGSDLNGRFLGITLNAFTVTRTLGRYSPTTTKLRRGACR